MHEFLMNRCTGDRSFFYNPARTPKPALIYSSTAQAQLFRCRSSFFVARQRQKFLLERRARSVHNHQLGSPLSESGLIHCTTETGRYCKSFFMGFPIMSSDAAMYIIVMTLLRKLFEPPHIEASRLVSKCSPTSDRHVKSISSPQSHIRGAASDHLDLAVVTYLES
jgi:hypothetical protein